MSIFREKLRLQSPYESMMMIGSIRILFSLVLCSAAINIVNGAFGNAGPKVCIENGCLSGKIMPGYQTESFEAFVGIPFAKPPVGSLRFKVSTQHSSVFSFKIHSPYYVKSQRKIFVECCFFLEELVLCNVYRKNSLLFLNG